jgi:hypothetical protein
MDSELPISSQNVQQPVLVQSDKPQGKKGLLIALLVVVILLVLLFIFFNYFNLPQNTSILPKQTFQKTAQSPSEVQIDKNSAAEILFSLIASSFKSEYQPNTFEFSLKPGLSDNSNNKNPMGTFHTDWKYENATAAALINLSSTLTKIDNLRIGFLTPVISQEITEQTAERLYSQYFSIIPKGKWKCQPNKNGIPGIYCENFWESDKIKIFSYIRNPSANNVSTASIVLCQIFPASTLYSWNSCNPFFNK